MNRIINNNECIYENLDKKEKELDAARVNFIIKRKIRGIAGRKKLGIIWMMLDPLATSLVYLFVLTIFRSSPNAETMFIGIGMYKIFQTSIKSGVNSISDFSGGLRLERIRTPLLIISMIKFRIIDTFLQSFGVILILLLAFDSNITGVIAFLLLCQILGIMSEGFALNLSLMVRKVPDLGNIINYILMLMFFGSPVLYSMEMTKGLHYKINEVNPFSYFVEFSRQQMGLVSEFGNLDFSIVFILLSLIIILAYRGFITLDSLRWRVSNWS